MISPTVNGVMTALLLIMFVGIWIWSWSTKRKPDFERMANLPLEEDFIPNKNLKQGKESKENNEKSEGAI